MEADGALLNQNTVRLRTNGRIDQRFLFYSLRLPEFQQYLIRGAQGSANQASITLKLIFDYPVLLPPVFEQQAIACILGALDDKIELNRRMNRTLEGLARALFQSWFIDFDPVHAKAAGQTPPGLATHVSTFFPDAFENSDLGKIPQGWRVGQIGDFVGLLGGYAFKSKDWVDQGIPVVKIGSVKPGIVDLSEVSFVTENVANAASRYRLKPADLLIGMTGYVGEVGLIPYTQNPPLLNQRVGKFVLAKSGTEPLGFVYCLTRRPEFKSAVETKSHGTAQANVSAAGILSVSVVLPPKQLRDHFDQLCKPLLDKILGNHAVVSTLAALRDTLLPKLILGELRVPYAERIVERAP